MKWTNALPTVVGALVAASGAIVPEVKQFVGANPELMSALFALLTAVANFSPQPHK